MIRRTTYRLRTTPQYVAARRRAVLVLRASDLVQRAATAVLPPVRTRRGRSGPASISMTGGAAFPADHGRRLPILVVVLLGRDPASASGLLATVREQQVLTGGYRPVVVVDTGLLPAVRAEGWVAEVLLDREQWARLHDPAGWPAYVRAHVERIVETYGATAVLPLLDPADPGDGGLAVVLGTLPFG